MLFCKDKVKSDYFKTLYPYICDAMIAGDSYSVFLCDDKVARQYISQDCFLGNELCMIGGQWHTT